MHDLIIMLNALKYVDYRTCYSFYGAALKITEESTLKTKQKKYYRIALFSLEIMYTFLCCAYPNSR